MPIFKKNIEAIEAASLCGQVKILVDGASVTQEYADTVGPDGSTQDASATIRPTKELLGKAEPQVA